MDRVWFVVSIIILTVVIVFGTFAMVALMVDPPLPQSTIPHWIGR